MPPQALIVGTIAPIGGAYLGHLYYDVAKATIVRMACDLSRELRRHGIASVSLAPGFMRTERVMATHAAYRSTFRRRNLPSTWAAPSPRSRPTPG